LLKKSETDKIMRQLNTKGVTLIPLAVGLVGAFAKCSIALARGRKKHDKREVIKAREQKRGLDRLMKQYR
jgi:SsrA-binding protein